MKLNTFFAFTASVMLGSVAFGDAANALVSFSSEGPDKYSDGTVVADGEWYALVWSADGNFEGFNSDGTPVDVNDKVVLKASLAKDGKCPPVVFQIDSKQVESTGVYQIYLLDTRKTVAGAAAASFGDVNGAVAAASADASSASAVNGGSASVATAGSWKVAGDAEGVRIVDFKVIADGVQIKVEGLVPGATYIVQMGEDVKALDSYQIAAPDSEATFNVKSDDANFFKVIRK